MSYILDALRRADAERERGSVPSLHAQSVQTMGSDDEPRRKGKPMVWVVAGLSLALAASIAWQFIGREAPREPAEGVVAQVPMNAQTAPAAAPPPAMTTQPGAAATAQPARSQLPPVPAPSPVLAPVPTPTPTPAPTPPAVAAVKTQTPTTAASPPAAAAAANIRIPTQDELPDDIRRQLPKLVVGGSIYSESAASRFLILNGQIFHENDKVMPELVLEQIKLKAAVLRYKNQRFSISY